MKRRTVIAGIGTVLVGSAGAFYLYRDDLTEFSASPVSVAAATRDDTGYEETGVEDVVVEREFEVGGQSENVVVTNYMTEHEKAVEMPLGLGRQRGAVFIALATPQVRILDREFNPVEDMSADDLVAMVQDNYEGIENVRKEEEGTASVLDQATDQTKYAAEATFDGSSVDISLHVSEAVDSDDGLVVTIGVYPQMLESQEEEHVLELMESVVDELPDSYEGDGGDEDESGEEDEEGEEGEDDANGDDDDGDTDDGDEETEESDDADGEDGDESDDGADDGEDEDEEDDDGIGLGTITD
ncbi:DUF6517 family protein [Natronoglomus mannanivorans]|uniref:DUF6517 family protein n=1 Tax=Natronoglomus mannanivorans TaxID=2979990 RepID=A0AAP2Z067_9EURY|nr:DUF6517 family protein [Halobacteria archaeon AArc-xg1-1]